MSCAFWYLDLYGAAVSVGLVVPLLVLLGARDAVELELAQRVVRPRLRGERAAARRRRTVRVVERRLKAEGWKLSLHQFRLVLMMFSDRLVQFRNIALLSNLLFSEDGRGGTGSAVHGRVGRVGLAEVVDMWRAVIAVKSVE